MGVILIAPIPSSIPISSPSSLCSPIDRRKASACCRGETCISSIKHACIDRDGRSTEAARSALRGLETAAEDTSQPACGSILDMLGIPADVQRTIFNRGSLGGPRKTSSAFDGCRGGDRVEKMVSVELAGYGAAGSSAHHVPNASASLGSDACAEAAHKEACIMNECPCATSESGDANVRRKANKLSEFSLEGDSAHAWDEGVALHAGLLEPPPGSDHNFLYPAEALRASGICRAGGETRQSRSRRAGSCSRPARAASCAPSSTPPPLLASPPSARAGGAAPLRRCCSSKRAAPAGCCWGSGRRAPVRPRGSGPARRSVPG